MCDWHFGNFRTRVAAMIGDPSACVDVWSTADAAVITYVCEALPNQAPCWPGLHTQQYAPPPFEVTMAKAYWITCYHTIKDPEKLASYAKLAAPTIVAGGGRILARSTATQAYEHGKLERTVLIEFDSVEQAVAVHDSAAYQAALEALGDGAVRDLRIVPGV